MAETKRKSPTEKLKLLTEFKQLDEAAQRKFIKYTVSGVVITAIGLIFIIVGVTLGTGAYSFEGLLVGLGTITVVIGIIRGLIGFINPLTPTDLDLPVGVSDQEARKELHDELFRE